MPGPVSDSYDPEWGTAANGDKIAEALDAVYAEVTKVVGLPAPIFILDLLNAEGLDTKFEAALTVKQWRIIRFALERAKESL